MHFQKQPLHWVPGGTAAQANGTDSGATHWSEYAETRVSQRVPQRVRKRRSRDRMPLAWSRSRRTECARPMSAQHNFCGIIIWIQKDSVNQSHAAVAKSVQPRLVCTDARVEREHEMRTPFDNVIFEAGAGEVAGAREKSALALDCEVHWRSAALTRVELLAHSAHAGADCGPNQSQVHLKGRYWRAQR